MKIKSQEELLKIQQESQKRPLPDQKRVFGVSEKLRRRVHNLPDPTRPPLGYAENKGFDIAFPYIRLPILRPPNSYDTVIFNAPETKANQLILGDNLEVLRNIDSETIDLIYIDPPFFSGRNYNVIWGDTNEVRSFHDIWEGGIDSYIVWLNARLWEMWRALKKTGSIYIHCDWHASHYIKSEMDKIFGYGNFQGEITWQRTLGHHLSDRKMDVMTDAIFLYSKHENFIYVQQYQTLDDEELNKKFPYVEKETGRRFTHEKLEKSSNAYSKGETRIIQGKKVVTNVGWIWTQETFNERLKENPYVIFWTNEGRPRYKRYVDEYLGRKIGNLWNDIEPLASNAKENIGYPTQKPEALLDRIINASSNEGDMVADFFCGGGTACAVAMKLKRRFIGCDSSRIAIAVTKDRLVKIGEEMSGVKSNISVSKEPFQHKLQDSTVVAKVPNIEVSYLGVYPIDKFEHLSQADFIEFILTCYGANANTAQGVANGFRGIDQREPILVGPVNPKESIDAKEIKQFFDEIKARLEPNKPIMAKVIGWRFSKQVQEYVKILERYIEDNKIVASDGERLIDIELIPIRSNRFRQRVLARYPNAEDADFFLRFPEAPVIGDIRAKKASKFEYEFEAMDAFSTEEDGWLVNCQWDFDYQEGHFAADKEYILSREKVKDKLRGEIFKAILKATHKFETAGEYTIACKVQDNLAGETVMSKKINIG